MENRLRLTPGNYKKLLSYKKSRIIYDCNFIFCKRFFEKFDRTASQMIQASRSGKQNIVEGCSASSTSKATEIKLLNVSRASLQELLEDYQDYLRVRNLKQWDKDSKEARYVRRLAYSSNESFETYRHFIETRSDETVANIIICLIHQCCYLLDRQIYSLEQEFIRQGGFKERMYRERIKYRNSTVKR